MKYFKLFSLLLLSFSAFADGTCRLTQIGDGTYTIICEGNGLYINYVDVTNEVYVIENCEQLKSDFISQIDLLDDDFGLMSSQLDGIIERSDSIKGSLSEIQNPSNISVISEIRSELGYIENYAIDVKDQLNLTRGYLSSPDDANSLYSKVNSITCGSCPTNSNNNGGSSGSCCEIDFTPVIDSLNSLHDIFVSISNSVSILDGTLSLQHQSIFKYINPKGAISNNSTTFPTSTGATSIRNILYNLGNTMSQTQASINNYLYHFYTKFLPDITNELQVLTVEATNHFSFFRKSVDVEGALSEFGMQSTFDNYYDYLTNHYIMVNEHRYSDLTEGQKEQTNWFSRVETLLAALVFGDDKSTNTVDSSYGDTEKDQLEAGLQSLEASSSSQVQLFDTMGDSLISSLRNIQSGFSSAIDYPSEIRLVSLPRSDNQTRSDSNDISFQSSDILSLVEACHCATTLAWCVIGLVVLFKFVSWSIRSSYSLIVFCYSVLSSVFGKG